MKRFNYVLIFLLALIFLVFNSCSETKISAVKNSHPLDISEYEFLRFSGGQELVSPDKVVQADNNWEILLSCLEAKTRNELQDKNIKVTDSQLMLLQAMRFIDYDDGTIKTTMPIFGAKEKQSLIPSLRQLAQDITPDLRNDILQLKEILTSQGYPDHMFSVLFSCVVDEQGRMTVPVIEMKMEDPVFLVCQTLASKIVNFMNQNLDLEALQKEFGFSEKEAAFVVVYHEWMWEFMEYLVGKGLIQKPLAFEQPELAGKKDIGKLLFVINGSLSNL